MSCLQYSRNTSYVDKRKTDPIKKIHTDISNLLRKRYYDARDSKNPNIELQEKSWQIYEDFKVHYNNKLKPQYLRGELTKEELLICLNELYTYYISNPIKNGGVKDNGNSRNNKK